MRLWGHRPLRINTLARLVPAGLAAIAAAACSSGPSSSGRTEVITVDGSSTVFPITEAVAEEYQRSTPGTKVTVGVSGTGGGFQKFCRGEIDVSNASRPITQTELDACGAKSLTFVELPIAYDGLTVVVNPKNTWVDAITVAELKRLWEPQAQGTIMRWSQIRPGWPDREVHLFGPGVDSGTFDYFTEAIVGKTDASRGDYTSSEDDNMLVQGVSGDELALGFFGFAYYESNRTKLRALPVDDGDAGNGAGAIAPSVESVRNGTYRPLSRPIFIYVSTRALARPEVKGFVDYYLAHAQTLVREVGYVPLTEAEYGLVAKRVQGPVTGTMFKAHHMEPGKTLESLLAAQ